jgi:hypothetical protein
MLCLFAGINPILVSAGAPCAVSLSGRWFATCPLRYALSSPPRLFFVLRGCVLTASSLASPVRLPQCGVFLSLLSCNPAHARCLHVCSRRKRATACAAASTWKVSKRILCRACSSFVLVRLPWPVVALSLTALRFRAIDRLSGVWCCLRPGCCGATRQPYRLIRSLNVACCSLLTCLLSVVCRQAGPGGQHGQSAAEIRPAAQLCVPTICSRVAVWLLRGLSFTLRLRCACHVVCCALRTT